MRDVDDYGVIRYFNHLGDLHREDGPAIIWPSGVQEWYINGCLHRLDGPAAIYNDSQYWYQHDVLHRLDGPAVEAFDTSYRMWFIRGQKYSEQEHAIIRFTLYGQ